MAVKIQFRQDDASEVRGSAARTCEANHRIGELARGRAIEEGGGKSELTRDQETMARPTTMSIMSWPTGQQWAMQAVV